MFAGAARRTLDLIVAIPALVLSVPFFAGVAMAMRLGGDAGPLFHRARRMGAGGRTFTLYKLRSMVPNAPGTAVTGPSDPRITRIGRLLRRTRLDELPQLLNVIRGDMSLVGPRPEDPSFVDWSDPLHREVFSARPGITGPTQLAFRSEASILDRGDPERDYRVRVLPAKLAIDREYLRSRTLRGDLRLLVRTALMAVDRASPKPVGLPPRADAAPIASPSPLRRSEHDA